MIPQASPCLHIRRYHKAVMAAMQDVIAGDQYILGAAVADFEAAFARLCGVRHCVAVNSGTDAVALALVGQGIGRGDEVLTVSMTAPGTAMAICQTGAEPRFVDIDTTRCLDVNAAAAAITPRTAAIVPVHFHGYPMDLAPLLDLARKHGLLVVEDCAHAHGARRNGRHVGSLGAAGAFSFYPTKNLGCVGDGGAIVTDDDRLAEKLRSLRSFPTEMAGTTVGINSRLDALQAAVLTALLPHLEERNRERVVFAEQYRQSLGGLDLVVPPRHDGSVYHQFAIAVDHRDHVRQVLLERGITTGAHYARPLHRCEAFADYAPEPLPVTDSFADSVISLPIQPEVLHGRDAFVRETVRDVLSRRAWRAA